LSYDNRMVISMIDELEFVKICDKIRREAMDRCTKIIIQQGKSIVSSRNLGKLKKKCLYPNGICFLLGQTHQNKIIEILKE